MTAVADTLATIAHTAGAVIMEIYQSDFAIEAKDDRSPVTAADQAGETIILEHLAEAYPDIPVVAEESVSQGHVPDIGDRFFLVDPLDGTREFIKRNGEFTVNIGLIVNGEPVAGVVYAPAIKMMLKADQDGAFAADVAIDEDVGEAAWSPVRTRPAPDAGLTVVASRSHRDAETEAFLTTIPVAHTQSAGSSLKFCLVARGAADIYPRFGPTMEWDTAAGHAVVARAGGSVTTVDGRPLVYGKLGEDFRNPGFIVRGA